MRKVNAGAPGSGRHKTGQSDTPMYMIAPGTYRGHLPKDTTLERRAAQEIEDRATVARYDRLGENLRRNINSLVPVD